MKTTRNIGLIVAFAGTFHLAACAASQPPRDLLSARSSYAQASKGPATTLAAPELHEARQQLAAAEASFTEDGDSQATRDVAYVALRKAQLAEVAARTVQATQSKEAAVAAMHSAEKTTVAATSAELDRTRTQLATQGVAMAAQGVALKDEKARSAEAEKRAAQAAADLAKFATVKQEARGMVISLSGGVLFVTAKADLLPTAQLKLNQVADALIKEDPLSTMVVEGHTDSQGADGDNQQLSQRRAQAVRDYLVSRGVATDRITAQGFGETRSIADNASPEGRANNRRVEIVVKPAGGAATAAP